MWPPIVSLKNTQKFLNLMMIKAVNERNTYRDRVAMGEEAHRSNSCSSSNSSGEEDGDADWKAAIESVSTDFGKSTKTNGSSSTNSSGDPTTTMPIAGGTTEEDGETKQKSKTFKLYQIKAQKLLDDIAEKSLVFVNDPIPALDNDPPANDDGVRLFRDAPRGIIFDPIEIQGPKKKPRIRPGEEFDEKSKKFKRQLKSVAVDGIDIMNAAREAYEKSAARVEAKDAAAKAKAKKEEERIAELKKMRGEKWLPSIAKEKAKIAKEQAKANKWEERMEELKKIKGDKWLPSIAKEERVDPQSC